MRKKKFPKNRGSHKSTQKEKGNQLGLANPIEIAKVSFANQNVTNQGAIEEQLVDVIGILISSLIWGVIVTGIVFCVRADQAGKTRRRELEHAERMAMIDKGLVPDDREVARLNAIGAIGVAVPISSFVSGAIATMGTLAFEDPTYQLVANVVIWSVVGLVCLITIYSIRRRLTETPELEQKTPLSK